MKAEIIKTCCDVDSTTLSLPGYSEHCITVQSCDAMHALMKQATERLNAAVVSQFVFAGREHYSESATVKPAVWLHGDACKSGNIYSTQAIAVSGAEPQPVMLSGKNIGVVYEDPFARYCRLHGVAPQNISASREEQVQSAFETMEAALNAAGFKFTDTVRTWIYLDRLLDWYTEFNTVRTNYFRNAGIFEHMVPASTGIGAANHLGAAIMMDVLAVQPKTPEMKIQEVISPLQNPALDYKSSFSRAVEMQYPTHRSLMISGTASIDPDGKTVFQDDPEKQIHLTLDVVRAILRSREMDWRNLFRGIAYFKDMSYLPLYQKIAEKAGIPRFPLAISHADVCRHDLLFEIEVDAVKIQ